MSVWAEINSWMQWVSEPREIATFSFARHSLTAKHADQRDRSYVHEHTWDVTVYWVSDRDSRDMTPNLKGALEPRQGKVLPDRISWAEPMAKELLVELGAAVVSITREKEGLGAVAMISRKEFDRLAKERAGAYSHWGSR